MLNAIALDEFPTDTLAAVKPAQADPNYLSALGTLGEVVGIRAIATCAAFVGTMFGKPVDEVLRDANDVAWAPLQREFDRIHREAGVA